MLTDRMRAGLDEYIGRKTSRYDYSGTFAYIVRHQNGDGTLELDPEDPKLSPPLSNVEIMYDSPATRTYVQDGAQCRVHFVNRDPSRYEAFGFRHGDFKSHSIGDNGFASARQGDLLIVGGVGLVITFVEGPAALAAISTGVPIPIIVGTVADPIGGWPGFIVTGSEKVNVE
jgi:hypothetical protein